MLVSIEIENFIFIKHTKIYLSPGFNVITGETGAGKSIFLSALAITLGEKVSPDIIKPGESEAEVESIFDLSGRPRLLEKLKKILTSNGVKDTSNLNPLKVSIKRIIQSNKKSKSLICDHPIPIKDLKKFAKNLIDIHSQHQNLNLLSPSFYISYLDRFLGLEESLSKYRESYEIFLSKKKLLNDQEKEFSQLKDEKGYLEFMVEELKGKTMSEADYEKAKKKLKEYEIEEKNQAQINDSLWQIKDALKPVITDINEKLKKITLTETDDKKRADFLVKNLKVMHYFSSLEDFLQSKKKLIPYQEKINELNNELSELERLKRKYQVSLNQLSDKLNSAQEKINNLKLMQETINNSKSELKRILLTCTEKALQLHLARKKGLPGLEKKILDELKLLEMGNSKIAFVFEKEQLAFEKEDKPEDFLNVNGFDKIDFHYGASLESRLKPLKDIASGGEISRIMLSLKSILSKKFVSNTMVFDEIDSGIGGETAIKIGEKIKKLAEDKQIIIITHLPQIAKFADEHFKVEKINLEKTMVRVRKLNQEETIKEISRMLGDSQSEASLTLAKEYKISS